MHLDNIQICFVFARGIQVKFKPKHDKTNRIDPKTKKISNSIVINAEVIKQ